MTTTLPDRISTLDTTRGVAVMGILLMNIVAFGMPDTAYMNPRAYGGAEGLDLLVYLFNFVLFDGKMRGLFSFLFGASMLLVIDRATAKGESPAKVHYRRMIWLLVFGLAHLWLVWWGDILSHYALIGAIAFLFRKRSVRALVIIGVVLVALETLLLASLPLSITMLEAGAMNKDPAVAAEAARQLAEFSKSFGIPPAAFIAEELAVYRGPYLDLVAARFDKHMLAPVSMFFFVGPETLAYMLFGMAGLRSGLLTGGWPRARYVRWLAIGFGIGIPAYAALAWYMVSQDFSLFSVVTAVMALTTPVRPLMIVGWACLIILLARPGGALTQRITATGRMAFTNYLVTSLICSTFFYGQGAGYFGYLSRAELYLVVFAVWACMLLWSKPWLEHYRYGPLEWLWRTLSRGGAQPMRGGAITA